MRVSIDGYSTAMYLVTRRLSLGEERKKEGERERALLQYEEQM